MDKELMDCTLSPYEIRQARFQAVISEGCPINATEFSIGELISEVTKAVLQSSKLKAYITEQVQAERERAVALEVIESLVSDDPCAEIAMKSVNKMRLSAKEAKLMAKKIDVIYRISHSVNPHSCREVHGDWRQEMNDLHKKFRGGE